MTESSTTDPAPPSVQEDHTQVIALLNSADMQKRLQDARVQRAKILEARKSGLTDPSDLTGNGGSLDFNSAVGPLGWDEASLILPAAVALKQPVSEQPHRQPQSYSLVIGLLSGLVLGSGMMWYSGFRFAAPAAAPDVAGTFVQQDQLAVDADGKDVEKIAADHFGVDPVPPIQASLADSIHTDSPLDLPLADQSPVKPDFGAFQAPQGSDRVPIRTASATAPAEADRPLPVLRLNAAIEEKLPVVTGESPPATHQRTTPILDAANATLQIQRVAQRPDRVMGHRHVGQHRAGINVHGMAAGGFDKTNSGRFQALAQIFGGAQAITQVVFLHSLLQPHGHARQVSVD